MSLTSTALRPPHLTAHEQVVRGELQQRRAEDAEARVVKREREKDSAEREISAVVEPFGDTSDAIYRQPLRVGRVDRC